MLLIVVRHGAALKGGALSPEGRCQVERLGERLRDVGVRVERALSATGLAATSTTSQLLDRLGSDALLEVRPLTGRSLSPPKSRRLLKELVGEDRHTLVVGGEDILDLLRSLMMPGRLGHACGRLVAIRSSGVLQACWSLGPVAIEKRAA